MKLRLTTQHFGKRLYSGALLLISTAALAQVSLPNGTINENVVDMTVKTVAGPVSIDRQFEDGRWQINMRWNPAYFSGEPAGDSLCKAYPELKVQGRVYTGDGQTWLLENRYSVRATQFFDGTDCVPNRIKTLRWHDRNTGSWMEYSRSDSSQLHFQLVKFGNKNDVSTSLEYDAQGRTKTVKDHFGKEVYQYIYTGERLTEIRDNPALIPDNTMPARSVKYEYSTVSNAQGKNYDVITKVTDIFGNTVQYGVANGNISSITDAEGRTRQYEYTAGRVTKFTDPNGKATTYVYDYDKIKKEFYVRANFPETAAGKRIVEQWYDPNGVVLRRDVNGKTEYQKIDDASASRTATQMDLAGRKTVTTTDEFGHIIRTVYPDGSQVSASYSSLHGQLTEEIDELGIKTAYEYDARGNLIRKTEAVGFPEQRVTEYEYNSLGLVVKETRKGAKSSDGVASAFYEYDNRGNRVKVIDPTGNTTRYVYDIVGSVIEKIDSNNSSWKSLTDKAGRTVTYITPLNKRTESIFDRVGNRIKSIDPLKNETQYVYDGLNRVVQTINALGGIRQLEYDEQGRPVAEINEAGQTASRSTYDPEGRIIQTQDIVGNTTSYEYDTSITPAAPVRVRNGQLTREMRYDARDREIEVIHSYRTVGPNGEETLASLSSKSIYDKKGQLIQVVDRSGNKTDIAYDALSRAISTTDSAGGVTKYEYDSRDNLLAIIDPKGNTTRYQYDGNNRRLKEIHAMGQTITYSYDAVGKLQKIVDPKGNQVHYTYDLDGQRVKEQHISAGGDIAIRTIEYTYNEAGSLTGVTDTNLAHSDHVPISQSSAFDALQRKTRDQISIGGQTVTLTTTYTVTGKRSTQTLADGSLVKYQYDSSAGAENKGTDYLQSIELPRAGNISVAARHFAQVAQVIYPGGSQRTLSYDALMRLRQIHVKSPGQQTLLKYAYDYDAEGNVTNKQTEYGNYAYLYDSLQRLTRVTPEISSGPGLPQEIYTYDRIGNRLTDNNQGGATVWQYNANSELLRSYRDTAGAAGTAATQIDYAYDSNGSVIKKTTISASDLLNNQEYIYDATNRLTEVRHANGDVIASYQYDSQGRRVRKTVYREAAGTAWILLTVPKTVIYFYSDDGLVAEYERSGEQEHAFALRTQYGWEPGSTWGTSPMFVKTKRGDASGTTADNEYFYYQNDHLGTPQQIIDSQGEVVWAQRSSAFGKATVVVAKITNNLRMPGQYFDSETGTHQNFFRNYDPAIGRYRETDPLGIVSDLALYTYGKNSPEVQIDPFGLCSFSTQFRQSWKRVDFRVITVSEWDVSLPRYEWGSKPSKKIDTKRVPGKVCYSWIGSDVWHYMLKRREDHEQLIEEIKVCESCEEECNSHYRCSDWLFNRVVNDRWVWWNVPWIESYYKGFEENPNPQEICLPLPPLRM